MHSDSQSQAVANGQKLSLTAIRVSLEFPRQH